MIRLVSRVVAVALALAILSGCGSRVETSVQSFAGNAPPQLGETIMVIPTLEQGRVSLEAQTWASLAESEFRKRGFVVLLADGPTHPKLVAVIGMAIDAGRDVARPYTIPNFGVTGYSGGITTGTVNRFGNTANYTANTTLIPQYGITGYTSGVSVDRVHRRVAMIRVFRVDQGANAAPVFEVSGASEGSCGMLASVAPAIIEGMLQDFPKPGARRVQVQSQGGC